MKKTQHLFKFIKPAISIVVISSLFVSVFCGCGTPKPEDLLCTIIPTTEQTVDFTISTKATLSTKAEDVNFVIPYELNGTAQIDNDTAYFEGFFATTLFSMEVTSDTNLYLQIGEKELLLYSMNEDDNNWEVDKLEQKSNFGFFENIEYDSSAFEITENETSYLLSKQYSANSLNSLTSLLDVPLEFADTKAQVCVELSFDKETESLKRIKVSATDDLTVKSKSTETQEVTSFKVKDFEISITDYVINDGANVTPPGNIAGKVIMKATE